MMNYFRLILLFTILHFSLSAQLTERVITTYSDGSVEQKYFYRGAFEDNDIAKKETYTQEGKLSIREHYTNGLKNGLSEMYDDSRRVVYRATYVDGLLEGKVTKWYSPGKKEYTEHYSKGKFEGEQQYYFDNGAIWKVFLYKEGKPHGIQKVFHQPNILEYESNYFDGQLHGFQKAWTLSSKPVYEYHYIYDNREGVQKEWNNGKLFEYECTGGLKANLAEAWEDGKLKYQSFEYLNVDLSKFPAAVGAKEIGREIHYYENGNKKSDITNINDQELKKWYENGQLEREGLGGTKNRTGQWTYWHANGQKKQEGKFENNIAIGEWTYWHDNGQLQTGGLLEKGLRNGEWTYYYSNGKVYQKGTWKNDLKVGIWKLYSRKGILLEEGPYEKGNKRGEWTYCYENGRKKKMGYQMATFISGPWKYWNEKGELTARKEFDPKGQLVRWSVLAYHRNSQKKSEGELTLDGLKAGIWTYWYESGELKREETFTSNGKRPVLTSFLEWYPNEDVKMEGNEKSAKIYEYHANGKPSAESVIIYPDRDPNKFEYYEEGIMKRNDNFEDVTVITERITYYTNGTVRQIDRFCAKCAAVPVKRYKHLPFKTLSREGKQEAWYENGKPKYEFEFKNGRSLGNVKEWYENGKPRIELISTVGDDRMLNNKGVYYNEKGRSFKYDSIKKPEKSKRILEVEVNSWFEQMMMKEKKLNGLAKME